jgi:Cys/Met metabolism PLP-dependent enzyme
MIVGAEPAHDEFLLAATAQNLRRLARLRPMNMLPEMRPHNARKGGRQPAAKVADFLVGHMKVAKVVYPGLQTGFDRKRADKYLRFGFGELVGFEPRGGEKSTG